MKPWTLEDYKEIVHLPTHLVVVIGLDNTFIKVNELTNPILGWDPDELVGEKVKNYIHPEDMDDTVGTLSGLFLGTKNLVTDFTNRCLRKDGTYRWISWSASIKGQQIFALGTDVTEKIQFEHELTIQGLVLESISEGVVISDEEGTIVYLNSAEEALLGYDSDELLGKPIQTINAHDSGDSKQRLRKVFDDIEKEGIWIGEWENVKKDGTRFTTSCRVTTLMLNDERHLVIVQRDITRRKKQQAEKDALQNRFRTFFEQSNLPMEIYDLEGNPLVVNKAWEDLFETQRSELEGYNILNDPMTEKTGLLPYLKRAYAGEAVDVPAFYIDPKTMMGRKGRARWLEAWFSPVKDENGKVKELAMILKDVTHTKETEAKLKVSQSNFQVVSDRLSMAVKIGQVGIWEWKPGQEKVYWDETLEGIYGYEPGTFSGRLEDYTSGLHPEDRESMWQTISESQALKKPYVVEHRIVRRNGEIRWVQGSGTTFYDEKNEPVLMMGTVIDITDKKIATLDQQFLSQVSETLSSSFNIHENLRLVSEMAIKYFCDGCLIDQLKADGDIERIVVAHPDSFKRQKLHQIHDKNPQRYSSDHPLFTALITGKTVHLEDGREHWPHMREKYGEDYYMDLAHINAKGLIFVRLKGRDNLLGTMTFITNNPSKFKFDNRSKWLAEEIAYRASMALENSLLFINSQEAIKSRDEFLSIASHELKTPLTSLTLQNQMRIRQLEKGDQSVLHESKFRKMIEADDRQLRRINRLIDDMLDIARIRAERLTIHKEQFEFCSFIKDVIDRFTPQMEAAGCDVSVNFTTDVILDADLYRIEQVVVNMLTNAMKYGAGKPIRIEITKTNYKVSFLVHDKGPGIDIKDVDRIFQRFERAVTGREISGLGLGLYISRQIVEQHDGTLFVTSKLGEGSTFVMELPVHA
jgi:PAS domain S-box-containing protein